MDARIAPPFMEATDASRLVCVVVVSYQEYSLTHTESIRGTSSESLVERSYGHSPLVFEHDRETARPLVHSRYIVGT